MDLMITNSGSSLKHSRNDANHDDFMNDLCELEDKDINDTILAKFNAKDFVSGNFGNFISERIGECDFKNEKHRLILGRIIILGSKYQHDHGRKLEVSTILDEIFQRCFPLQTQKSQKIKDSKPFQKVYKLIAGIFGGGGEQNRGIEIEGSQFQEILKAYYPYQILQKNDWLQIILQEIRETSEKKQKDFTLTALFYRIMLLNHYPLTGEIDNLKHTLSNIVAIQAMGNQDAAKKAARILVNRPFKDDPKLYKLIKEINYYSKSRWARFSYHLKENATLSSGLFLTGVLGIRAGFLCTLAAHEFSMIIPGNGENMTYTLPTLSCDGVGTSAVGNTIDFTLSMSLIAFAGLLPIYRSCKDYRTSRQNTFRELESVHID